MSYCRWSDDSDVYLFMAGDGLHCCGCRLTGLRFEEFINDSYREMIDHLDRHTSAGQRVPADAIHDLSQEVPVFDDKTASWRPELRKPVPSK
jgi:hypothetical protein